MSALGPRMTRSLAAALSVVLLVAFSGPVEARGPHRSHAPPQAVTTDESQLVEHGHYTNKDGRRAAR